LRCASALFVTGQNGRPDFTIVREDELGIIEGSGKLVGDKWSLPEKRYPPQELGQQMVLVAT
jgi:hypothetical protein